MNIYDISYISWLISWFNLLKKFFLFVWEAWEATRPQVEHRKGLQEEAELQRQRQHVNDLEKALKGLEAECLGPMDIDGTNWALNWQNQTTFSV